MGLWAAAVSLRPRGREGNGQRARPHAQPPPAVATRGHRPPRAPCPAPRAGSARAHAPPPAPRVHVRGPLRAPLAAAPGCGCRGHARPRHAEPPGPARPGARFHAAVACGERAPSRCPSRSPSRPVVSPSCGPRAPCPPRRPRALGDGVSAGPRWRGCPRGAEWAAGRARRGRGIAGSPVGTARSLWQRRGGRGVGRRGRGESGLLLPPPLLPLPLARGGGWRWPRRLGAQCPCAEMTHGPVTSRESAARGPSHTKSRGETRAPAAAAAAARAVPGLSCPTRGAEVSPAAAARRPGDGRGAAPRSPRRGAPPRRVGEERGGGRAEERASGGAGGAGPAPPPAAARGPALLSPAAGRELPGAGGSLFVAWNVAIVLRRGVRQGARARPGCLHLRGGGRRRRGTSGTVTPPPPPASPPPLPLPSSPRAGHIDPPGQGSDRKHQPPPPPPRARGSDRGSGPSRRVRGARGVLTAAPASRRGLAAPTWRPPPPLGGEPRRCRGASGVAGSCSLPLSAARPCPPGRGAPAAREPVVQRGSPWCSAGPRTP